MVGLATQKKRRGKTYSQPGVPWVHSVGGFDVGTATQDESEQNVMNFNLKEELGNLHRLAGTHQKKTFSTRSLSVGKNTSVRNVGITQGQNFCGFVGGPI